MDGLVERMRAGDRRAVARLITAVENDLATARLVSERVVPLGGKATILGITGSPGSGKSSLVSQLVPALVAAGRKVGVIAVDPTSPFSGGALLGDRIRMKDAGGDKVFIRSMASRGQLGGMSRAVKDACHVLDAYGCDTIIIETVGVGQGEVDIHDIALTTIVVMVPGMGDEIQTFKAGIMEICDVFVVNKMDHEGADRVVGEIESMLDLDATITYDHDEHHAIIKKEIPATQLATGTRAWRPPVVKTNALTGEGIPLLLDAIDRHGEHLVSTGAITERLRRRARKEILDILKERFELHLDEELDAAKNGSVAGLIDGVATSATSGYSAADEIGDRIARKWRNG